MLASAINEWPDGGGWVLEPKYDGYRLLVQTRPGGRVCAWSRHGTSLTEPLRELLAPLEALGSGWVFDGELIALDDHDGRPVQDFAAVGRAAFGRDRTACSRVQYVAFDVLATGDGGDVQTRPWRERCVILADRFPAGRRLRVVSRLAAHPDSHARLVAMGFEGSVLKRETSSYRPGRTRAWRKLKARHTLPATIAGVHRDRDGRLVARCSLNDGRRCSVRADSGAEQLVGLDVTVVFSRTDADGSLREPRLLKSSSSPPQASIATAALDIEDVGQT
jgi:ATP-dependent DNA ligase